MIGGPRIVGSPYWPKTDIKVPYHYDHHPSITWLFGKLNRHLGTKLPMTIQVIRTVSRDADPIFASDSGTFYCSMEQAAALRNSLK